MKKELIRYFYYKIEEIWKTLPTGRIIIFLEKFIDLNSI